MSLIDEIAPIKASEWVDCEVVESIKEKSFKKFKKTKLQIDKKVI